MTDFFNAIPWPELGLYALPVAILSYAAGFVTAAVHYRKKVVRP